MRMSCEYCGREFEYFPSTFCCPSCNGKGNKNGHLCMTCIGEGVLDTIDGMYLCNVCRRLETELQSSAAFEESATAK